MLPLFLQKAGGKLVRGGGTSVTHVYSSSVLGPELCAAEVSRWHCRTHPGKLDCT